MEYLDTAMKIAHRFLMSLPEDHVPYWDFNSDEEDKYARDSSAACIAASGMLELAQVAEESGDRKFFQYAAKEILGIGMGKKSHIRTKNAYRKNTKIVIAFIEKMGKIADKLTFFSLKTLY